MYIFQLDYLVPNITKLLKKFVNNYSVGFGTFIIFFILCLVLSIGFVRTFFYTKKPGNTGLTTLFFEDFNYGSIFSNVIPEFI